MEQKLMPDVIRAEVVASMLRPQELLDAREQVAAGAITRTEFKRIEDRAIDEAIALQERAGVEVVTTASSVASRSSVR